MTWSTGRLLFLRRVTSILEILEQEHGYLSQNLFMSVLADIRLYDCGATSGGMMVGACPNIGKGID
jgi:hypothetical protein